MSAVRLRQIGRYLRPHRRQVALGAGALLVVNLLGVAIPLQVRSVVNALHAGFSLEAVLRQALLIVTMATVMGLVRLWSRMLVFGVGRQVEADLKQRIFDHVLTQEPGWLQGTGSGEVISRATSDVENVRRLLGFAILSLTNTLLAYSLTLPAMLAIDPLLTLAAWLGGKGRRRAWQRRRRVLRRSPAACQMLFQRRPAAILAEHIDPSQWPPTVPMLQLIPSPPSPDAPDGAQNRPDLAGFQTATVPAADTPLGLAEEATATAIRQFLAATLLTPTA